MPITYTATAENLRDLRTQVSHDLDMLKLEDAPVTTGAQQEGPQVSDAPPADEPKRRGRKPRQNPTAAEAAPLRDSSASQPAVEENTGSAPAVQSPAAEGVVANGGGDGAQAVTTAAMTVEEFKAKLLGLQPEDVDTNAWQQRVYETLTGFGYQRVKEVKPEHYAAIIAKLGG